MNWSNPYQGQPTGPELNAHANVLGPAGNFGPLIAAILANKKRDPYSAVDELLKNSGRLSEPPAVAGG